MEKRHGEWYCCKRLRLLQHLVELGYKPEKTIPDPTNPSYNWFLFRNSRELEMEIDNYFEALKR